MMVWRTLIFVTLWRTGVALIRFNEPFQVVMPTANHSSMIPVVEGLSKLAQHPEKISVVSVVGPYHSGKSFLLNALIGNTQVFSVGRKVTPETMGIWMCRTEMRAIDGSEVWLLDSEGFFGPGVSEDYDAKVFTLASLLGGHVVYNTVKIIDQQAVHLLEMLARRAQLFRTRSSADAAGIDTPEFLSVRSFPPLTWVVEDFFQELPSSFRQADGATEWLKSYLTKSNGTNRGGDGHFLTELYADLKVHTLFLPATTREQLQDLSRLSWEQLTPEFKSEVEALKTRILTTLEARKFEGNVMTGKTFERVLRFMVQALQRGFFHELPSMWATWTAQVSEMSLQDAVTWFASLLTQIDTREDPIPVALLTTQAEEARDRASKFYKELLRDFYVNVDMTELTRRMATHFDQKMAHYHERVQRWVGQLIAEVKEKVASQFAAMEIPVDPEVLKKYGENATKTIAADFSKRIAAFALRGPPVKLGRPATMPTFAQDPATTLTNDLRTLQGMRELENEREIMQFFKKAAAAADEAVDTELKANSKRLLGKNSMNELQRLVTSRCWQAFDEPLIRHKWMMQLTHYKTHRAYVQSETLESRMARFHTTHNERLAAHFRTALERCITSYKARKANIAMPVSETDLDSEHRNLANQIREMLDDQQGRDLTDTELFKGALRSLNTVLEEGYSHTRQKNIELWKVHSDEATRCALRENHILERRCGLSCMYNKVPHVHKRTSEKHLFACLARSGAGSRMSPSMQKQVFNNWYAKDLAHDADAVWNNFYIASALVGFLVIVVFGLCGRCAWWQPPPPAPAYMPQSAYGQYGQYRPSPGPYRYS